MKSIGILFSLIVIVFSSCTTRTIEDDIRDGFAKADYIVENLATGEIVIIPYEDTTLPLLLYTKRDTVICMNVINEDFHSNTRIIGFNSNKIIAGGSNDYIYSDDSTFFTYFRGVIHTVTTEELKPSLLNSISKQ